MKNILLTALILSIICLCSCNDEQPTPSISCESQTCKLVTVEFRESSFRLGDNKLVISCPLDIEGTNRSNIVQAFYRLFEIDDEGTYIWALAHEKFGEQNITGFTGNDWNSLKLWWQQLPTGIDLTVHSSLTGQFEQQDDISIITGDPAFDLDYLLDYLNYLTEQTCP